jgi:hypothetical protein
MIRQLRIMRPAGALFALLLALLTFAPVAAYHDDPNEHHDFANQHFENTWARTDKPVADGQVQRTWMWGPEPYTPGMQEPYSNSPGGMREVQYFDKSRMEINNPNAPDDGLWFVTNGLLVVEMVDGKYQTGDAQFDDSPDPADIPIAGDPGGTSPTYADIAEYGLRDEAALADGAAITQTLDDNGNVTTDASFAQYNVTAAHRVTVPGIDHQVASPFWDFMNSSGLVYENGQTTNALLFENPFYATGYPLTEAYWTTTNVGGTEHDVLWQCFERRCLTYTPQNDAGFQVEAGNVGQHYYQWRHGQQPPANTETLFTAHLTGDQEGTAVTTDATGDAVFCLSADGQTMTYMITVQNITDATLAHIHLGAAGVTGNVVVPLYPTDDYPAPFSGSGTLVEGSFTAADFANDLAGMTMADLVDALTSGGAYVNVHSTQNPMGEIRGQVAVADNIEMSASLSGAEEVPPVTTDATGTATYTYDHDTHTLHYQLDVNNITDATAAHIHLGDVGASGNVVAPLFPTDEYTAPFSGSGTLTQGDITSADLVNDLAGMSVEELVCQMLMGHTYTNVHTTANPMGEIRGQNVLGAAVTPPAETDYSVTLGALNASGVTGSGTLAVTGDQVHVMLDVHGLEVDQDHMSHIHGFDDGTISVCPTPALDTNGDGIISLAEGLPAYGAVQLDLGMLTPDAGGDVSLDQTYTLDDTQLAALGDTLADNTIVLHGLTVGDTYDASVPVACGLVAANDASQTFVANLTGDQEAPPVDTDATGTLVIRVDANGTSLSWQLIGNNFDENATEAILNAAAMGENGDPVFTLWFTEGMPFTGTGQIWSGLITVDSPGFGDMTLQDAIDGLASGMLYVNVQTAETQSGYIRGQIGPYS